MCYHGEVARFPLCGGDFGSFGFPETDHSGRTLCGTEGAKLQCFVEASKQSDNFGLLTIWQTRVPKEIGWYSNCSSLYPWLLRHDGFSVLGLSSRSQPVIRETFPIFFEAKLRPGRCPVCLRWEQSSPPCSLWANASAGKFFVPPLARESPRALVKPWEGCLCLDVKWLSAPNLRLRSPYRGVAWRQGDRPVWSAIRGHCAPLPTLARPYDRRWHLPQLSRRPGKSRG